MKTSFVFLFLLTQIISGCSTTKIIKNITIHSPLGIYKSNTTQKFWLSIMQNNQYLLCSPSECYKGLYERLPVNYGVILIDFYASEIGLQIERLSHGEPNTNDFYTLMKTIRLSQLRANDLAFNIDTCQAIPCVGLGHRRDGFKFLKIENFDSFWQLPIPVPVPVP